MIIIKSPREIDLMREAGRVAALVFEQVGPMVQPGVSTAFLDEQVERVMRENGAIPA